MAEPHQDWERVVIRQKQAKKAAAPATAGSKGASASSTEKKYTAGTNARKVDANMAKLDAESENLSHKKVGLGLGKAIQQARSAKKMTQAALAQAINEKPAVINQYENGKAIPNGQLISKIERALGAKLPRPPKK
eukprot:GO256345.1.p1 GENE.GO256345.1~~GO256345.1.p1  ORF type:complete len:135 (+),score=11.87 GO256345.1:123-527(+)